MDYFVATTELLRSVTDFVVGNFNVSDHFPVVCTLQLNPNIRSGEDDAYKRQESSKDDFIEGFEGLFVNFQCSVDSDFASSLNAFVALYKEAGTGMKRTYPKNKTSKTSNTREQPDWWDEDCSNAKYE